MNGDQGAALAILAILGAAGGCGLAAGGHPRIGILWAALCCLPAFVPLYIKALMG